MLGNIPAGAVRIKFAAPGYIPATITKNFGPTDSLVEVAAAGFDGGAFTDVDPERRLKFELAPLTRVHGRVHAADGAPRPIGGARFPIFPPTGPIRLTYPMNG